MTTLATESRPEHLERLQTLFVKLLFCEPTRAAYCRTPDEVLAYYRLSTEYRKILPDADSEKFKVEAQGRRMRVFRETYQIFPNTIKELDENLKKLDNPEAGPDFNSFLSSDAFIDPNSALPAPDGSGAGYESVSKFFFWVRGTCRLMERNAPTGLRTAANTEFAHYLITQAGGRCDPYYDRFREGIRWCETPGTALPLYVLTNEFRLGKLNNAADAAPFLHLVDLDTVTPLAPPVEPNIR